MSIQQGLPPFTFRCFTCNQVWDPRPVQQGPTKGTHSDSSLEKSFQEHLKVCGKQ